MVPLLIRSLLTAAPWPHRVSEPQLIETHISWVILTGVYAYKIKKPLNLGFLDFSTLERRRHACEEELRLNRRLAPDLYLELMPIGGSPAHPAPGVLPAFEYAVRMRQFPAGALLSEQLAAGRLQPADIRQLAVTLARFHGALPAAAPDTPWGRPATVWAPIDQSLQQLEGLAARHEMPGMLAALPEIRHLLEQRFGALRPLIEERRLQGRVRECHGDLHLANLIRLPRGIVPFDALEFDPALRWTDVMAEAAFLLMDLCLHERRDLAAVFLNEYLSESGDYAGLPLQPLLLAARALVRAKVRLLAPAGTPEEIATAHSEAQRMIDFAGAPELLASRPRLIVVCGASGTGKTWLSRQLAAQLPAIHLRSDVERKRLAGLDVLARSGSAPGQGLYTAELSARTYSRLAALASGVVDAGFHVLIDAAALTATGRAALLRSARAANVPTAILYLYGREELLAERIRQRARRADDASEADEAVLAGQLRTLEVPVPAEASLCLAIDVADLPPMARLTKALLGG